jgi:hypothetical protein
MAINLYEFFDLTRENFSDYVSRYEIELSNFLSKFEDNTESLFIDYQKVYLKKMTQAIIQSINEIDSNDPDGEFIFDYLEKKLSTNRRILEFLDNRMNTPQNVIDIEQNENILKSTSNDKIKDLTKMPWFIVGLNIANGKVFELYNEGLTYTDIALKLGSEKAVNISHGHISSSFRMEPSKDGNKYSLNLFDFDWKIEFIHNYCINKGIPMTPKFEKIAEKYM